jgi:hypothetical protein
VAKETPSAYKVAYKAELKALAVAGVNARKATKLEPKKAAAVTPKARKSGSVAEAPTPTARREVAVCGNCCLIHTSSFQENCGLCNPKDGTWLLAAPAACKRRGVEQRWPST